MTNISSVWQVGDVTFKAVEFDEDTTLTTTHAKFIGEIGSFVSQEVSGATLRIRAFTENLSSLIQELHSADILKLRRYDGYLQYVEFNRRNSRLEAPIVRNKEVELEFIVADPYKYSPNENSLSFNLDSTSKEVTINAGGEVKTPLDFAIESYRLASATKSYSSTGKSYEITGYGLIKASDCDIKALRKTPTLEWFDEHGILFPSPENESGWVWEEILPGFKKYLDIPLSPVLENHLPVTPPYIANFIQIKPSYAGRDVIFKINLLDLGYSHRDTGCTVKNYNTEYGGYCLAVWDDDLEDWQVIQSSVQNLGDTKFVHYTDYGGSSILIGYKNDNLKRGLDYCASKLVLGHFQIGLCGYSIVSIFQVPNVDYYAPIEVTIGGTQDFNGNMYINIYPASVDDVNNRSFNSNVILKSFTISGNDWGGSHTFRFNPSGFDTFALELNPEYTGSVPRVNIYQSSTTGDGLIFYERTIAGEQIFNVTHNSETIIAEMRYKTPMKRLKIRSLLDRSTELVFNGAFLGENGHFNDSNYYRFNPFESGHVDDCIVAKASGASVYSSQIILDSGEWVQFGLYSLAPFANFPEGHWSGSGDVDAYISLNSTTDTNYMYKVVFANSPYMFPIYNSGCNLLGKDHFYLHLVATTYTTISNMEIRSPVSFANKGFVYLYPNKANKIFIEYKNLNSDATMKLKWRDAYL